MSTKLSLMLACFFTIFGIRVANARQVAHPGLAMRQASNAIPVAVEDVECQQCETAWIGEVQGGVLYLRIHHRFTGSCGGGSEVSTPVPAREQTPIVPTSLREAALYDEGESYCARCGGTSSCHSEWDEGSCHLQCGSGGGEVSWQAEQELRVLLREARFADARALIDRSDRLSLHAASDRVTVLGCGDEVFSEVRLDRSVTQALSRSL